MLNNHHKISDCAFAESIVAYLYDEASAAEKRVFEVHLEDCASCVDELAEISLARTAVHEWRIADFDLLPTPIFEIPIPTIRSTANDEKPSWLAGWRQIFAFKPALAMSSLVILIALFSVAAFIFNFKKDEQIVENLDNKNPTKSVASPTVERKNDERKENEIIKKSETPEVAATNPPVKIAVEKATLTKSAPVKVSSDAPKINPAKVVQKDSKRTPKTNSAAKSDTPALTEADDEEDDSIRLADLFDEIGTE